MRSEARLSRRQAPGCAQHHYSFCPGCSGRPIVNVTVNGEPIQAEPQLALVDAEKLDRLEQIVLELIEILRAG